MLGGYISDLEAGDVFEPVEYELTAFMCREYAHGVEENCLKEQRVGGAKGPAARVHFEYFARHKSPAYVGEKLIVSGKITDRYIKRGRDYLEYYLEVKTSDGRLVTVYTDKTLLAYKPVEEVKK
jgi:hypothetical protein